MKIIVKAFHMLLWTLLAVGACSLLLWGGVRLFLLIGNVVVPEESEGPLYPILMGIIGGVMIILFQKIMAVIFSEAISKIKSIARKP